MLDKDTFPFPSPSLIKDYSDYAYYLRGGGLENAVFVIIHWRLHARNYELLGLEANFFYKNE